MKQSLVERFLFWWCDKFGHAKPRRRFPNWYHNDRYHFACPRCRRIVSEPEPASHD